MSRQGPRCADCRCFCNEALFLERETPGLAVLGSAFATVRAQDGICSEHSRYVPAQATCNLFRPRMR